MTLGLAPRPALRLLPAPVSDPPYDDEREPVAPPTDGSLALAFPPPREALPLRLVPPARPRPQAPEGAVLPDVRAWGARLSQAIVEVLSGSRPAAQLSAHASFDVLQQLERWSGRFSGRATAPARNPRVMSVHVCEPGPGIAEACASVDTGPRRRAFAMRLEVKSGHWELTALELG
jgi:uncharacterized protein DUF6459